MMKGNLKKYQLFTPNQRQQMGYFATWKALINNIFTSKDLIWELYKRDFLMRYKKSFLGMGWLFLSPLIGILAWVFMNAAGVLRPGELSVPYPAYVLLSTTLWGLFMNFSRAAVQTMNISREYIKQVPFHHDALFIKQFLQEFTSFLIVFAFVVIVLLLFGVIPSLWILMTPVLVLPMCFFAGALGIILSVPAAAFSDIEYAYQYFLQMLMFITPVVYTSKTINVTIRNILYWNPLTYLVGSIRDLVLFGRMEHVFIFLMCSFFSLGIFLVSWRFFYLAEYKVVERMV